MQLNKDGRLLLAKKCHSVYLAQHRCENLFDRMDGSDRTLRQVETGAGRVVLGFSTDSEQSFCQTTKRSFFAVAGEDAQPECQPKNIIPCCYLQIAI